MSSFEGENMQTQYNVSGHMIYLHFHNYKLAIKIDENGHSDRNIDCEIEIQKAIEQQLSYNLLVLILTNKTLIFLELSMKYLKTSNNGLKKL